MILFNEFKNWLSYIKDQFHTITTLLVLYFIYFFVIVSPIHAVIKNDFDYEKIVYLILFACITIYWLWYKLSYPRNNKKQIGLVISIYAEGSEELKLKNLFLKELIRNINDAELHKVFNVINIKNHLAKKVNNKDELDKLHKKVNGHIYFYGDIQKELDGKSEKYFLVIDGEVKHMPIPIQTSLKISFDFRKLLPKEINFDSFFGLRGCKVTANIAYLTSKYISGIASFVSGNPFLAYRLHNGLEKELEKYNEINVALKNMGSLTEFDLKYLKAIKRDLPLIISNECLIIARAYYENSKIIESKKYLDLALKNNPKNYGLLLFKAIYDFMIDENPENALNTIKQAEKYANDFGEWRYSKTFLLFWQEDYLGAWKECQKISRHTYPNEDITIQEIEVFNLNLLKKYKNKPQLYFWLGYTQYKIAENIPMAFKYFKDFVNEAEEDMDFLKKKANSFLSEIEKEMKIK